MKLLFLDWNSYCRKDILQAFQNLGHTYSLYPLTETAHMLGSDQKTIQDIYEHIERGSFDFAFTMNYFPMVSTACEQAGIPYISWIYDNPFQNGYSVNIINSCNYIFTFDSAMYHELSSQGVSTIHYAPMAANPERLLKLGRENWGGHSYDISFVGALYNEDHNFYDEFVKNARIAGKEYYIGYIDSLIQIQLHLYGTNILSSSLPKEIAESHFASINEWTEQTAYFTTQEAIFADNVLCRKITAIEREQLLQKLSALYSVSLFTRDAGANLGQCQNLGYIDYYSGAPAVFHNSAINLNISLRSIKNGIPLRAIEIMGAGGFLLSNFQSDFLQHFEPEHDFVYYENIEDAVEKAGYYLTHPKERQEIAMNGWKKIKKYHTYEQRITEMLSLLH